MIFDDDKEYWKIAPGYPNYEVSTHGRVYSCLTGKMLTGGDRRGYVRYQLMLEKKKKYVDGHRLVALAFLPNPDDFPQVNHKDHNRKNNNVNNLEWCTNKENQKSRSNHYKNLQVLIKDMAKAMKDCNPHCHAVFECDWETCKLDERLKEVGLYDGKDEQGEG